MAEPDPSQLSGRRILVVEDDFLIAADLAEGLQELGMTVVGPASSVSDALLEIEAAPDLDAAVLDVNLSGETIFEVADALRTRGVPFIFATGYSVSAVPPEYAEVPRCEKPVPIQALVRCLEHQFQT